MLGSMPKVLAPSGMTQQQLMCSPRGCSHMTSSNSRHRRKAVRAAVCSSVTAVLHTNRSYRQCMNATQQQSTLRAVRHTSAPLSQTVYPLCGSSTTSSSRRATRQSTTSAAHLSAARSAVADIDPSVFTDPSIDPKPFVGPIAAALIPGGSRGYRPAFWGRHLT